LEASLTYLREKAAQCRRLANRIINRSDPAVARLLTLADELDARAQAAESEAVQAAVEKQEETETAPEMPIAAMKPPEQA
jgi:hypothetical protein